MYFSVNNWSLCENKCNKPKKRKRKKHSLWKSVFLSTQMLTCVHQAVMKTPKDAEIPVLSLKNQAMHSTVRWSCCASIRRRHNVACSSTSCSETGQIKQASKMSEMSLSIQLHAETECRRSEGAVGSVAKVVHYMLYNMSIFLMGAFMRCGSIPHVSDIDSCH